jgi:DNA replication and repair protein RecF
MLNSLHLRNFRSHKDFSLECGGANVVISGANGIGKTNILEAISMFAVGKGFRQAVCSEQLHQSLGEVSDFWAVQAELHLENIYKITTGYNQNISSRRIIKVDDESLAKQSDILQYLSVIWFLPTQAHLFLSGASERRKYFDRIVYSYDATHAGLINNYEHYMRERGRLLKSPNYDGNWAGVLEAKIVDYSLKIAEIRLKVLQLLRLNMFQILEIFPKADLSLKGDVEDLLLAGVEPHYIIEQLIHKLQQNRIIDAKSGRCSVGAHRTKLEVFYVLKQRAAESCSTGEQKALLISILIAQINMLMQNKNPNKAVILLLDEMAAHLDPARRVALFELIHAAGIQLFATGTESETFSLLKNAVHIKL